MFWLYVSCTYSTVICENTLLLSYFDKEEKCLWKDGWWKRICCEENLGMLIFLVKYVKCWLKTIQHKLLLLNLICQEERLKHFSFSEWLLIDSRSDKDAETSFAHLMQMYMFVRGTAQVKISLPSPCLAQPWMPPGSRHLQVIFSSSVQLLCGRARKLWYLQASPLAKASLQISSARTK